MYAPTYRTQLEHERKRRRQAAADRDMRRWAQQGREEQERAFDLECIGMSTASAAALTEEPHERMWNEIERMGEAHFTDEDER